MKSPGLSSALMLWFCVFPALLTSAQFGGGGFEIPAEMLQQMMGGGNGGQGGGKQKKDTEWPNSENSEVAPEFDWLVNTEWKGKTAKYLFLKGGQVESPLKECEEEGQCLWAANNDRVLLNTPTLKVVKFTLIGYKEADKKKLENKDQEELAKIILEAVPKPGKENMKKSQLKFEKVAMAVEGGNIIARDLYELLGLTEDVDQSQIKSAYRRLSVKMHPDKGGDPAAFAEMKDAYEILSNVDYRKYYTMGGMQLVRNAELAWKEVEGQKGQMDAQLNQIPKTHPQYKMAKMQIDQQKQQFEGPGVKAQIEEKLRNEDTDVYVPVSAQELYTGVASKTFEFKRLRMCKGCRLDPETKPECKDCGRCPPEKIQVPKYSNTPFGKQVTGMTEKEQESRERCREVPVLVENLKIPKGATEGTSLKKVRDIGHETPGKIPGKVHFKVQRGSPTDTYTIAEADLHTVLQISLEEALFGFTRTFKHLGDESVTIEQDTVTKPDQVFKLNKKGLASSHQRGDLYVRVEVEMPDKIPGQKETTLKAPATQKTECKLSREENVELREGSAWRRWNERGGATVAELPKK